MKKPKDLKIPFSFEERKPIIIDRFFVVPKFYEHHKKWGVLDFNKKEIFGNENPINIEYCSGNGQWILQKAKENLNINWIAVDMRFDRVRKIWVKMYNMKIKNLFVVFSEAHLFTKYYLKNNIISNVFINFPDPWPKRKHAKNRFVTPLFMQELTRAVKKGSIATFVTDDDNAANFMIDSALSCNSWKALFPKPYYITELPKYGCSYFNNLWREKGKVIKYIKFEKHL